MLANLPIVPVKVLFEGNLTSLKQLLSFIGKSYFCDEQMEGLYIKIEEDGVVKERYKYVRASFLTEVLESGSHWFDRPITPNKLKPDVDIFAFHE